jgi:hypothetical protein
LSIKDLESFDLNLESLNIIKNLILELLYHSNLDVENSKRPELTSWEIIEYSYYELKLRINITNALYVSSTNEPDRLKINILS